jgi:proline iminopeptidase
MIFFNLSKVDYRRKKKLGATQPKEQWFNEPQYVEEGFVLYMYNGKTYKLWYGKVGIGDKPPLLVLHGGPGGNHHNLVPLQVLGTERTVIFYDQLGCGNSERPDNPSLWTAERYFEEVKAVRDGLGLRKYHLLGHSWGTTLATGFAHKYPDGILTLSLHSPVLSFPYYREKVAPVLRSSLPDTVVRIIEDCENRGIGCDKTYDEAVTEFVKRYVILTWPLPEPMQRSINLRNKLIHDAMVGTRSELNVHGNLRDVDISGYLKDFTIPILFTCGRHDLCTPEFTEWHRSFSLNSEMYIIEESAHMTLMDQPARVIQIQMEFMSKYE